MRHASAMGSPERIKLVGVGVRLTLDVGGIISWAGAWDGIKEEKGES